MSANAEQAVMVGDVGCSRKRSRQSFSDSLEEPTGESSSARDFSPVEKRQCRAYAQFVMDAVCVPAAVANGRMPNLGRMAPLYDAARELLGPAKDAVNRDEASNEQCRSARVEGGSALEVRNAASEPAVYSRGNAAIRSSSIIVTFVSCEGQEERAENPFMQRVFGDGRCAFRALARAAFPELLNSCGRDASGLAMDAVVRADERQLADLLRSQVANYFQEHAEEVASLVETSDLDWYILKLADVSTWVGEPELYVAAKHVLDRVVEVWILPEDGKEGLEDCLGEGLEDGLGGVLQSPRCIQRYEPEGAGRALEPLRLLYNGSNHWDLYVGPARRAGPMRWRNYQPALLLGRDLWKQLRKTLNPN